MGVWGYTAASAVFERIGPGYRSVYGSMGQKTAFFAINGNLKKTVTKSSFRVA